MVQDPHEVAFRRRLETFHEGLGDRVEMLPSLDWATAKEVLAYLLDLACRAQHVRNIELGRETLLALPRTWLLAHIEALAEPLISLNDEWEFRRLLEVYERLDKPLAQRLAERGLSTPSPDIREAGREFLEQQ
jgi:hypothetical protein